LDGGQLIVFGTEISKSSNNYNSLLKSAEIILLKARVTAHIEPNDKSISICEKADSSIQSLIHSKLNGSIYVRIHREKFPELKKILKEMKGVDQVELLKSFVCNPKQLEYLIFYLLYHYESQEQTLLIYNFKILSLYISRNNRSSLKLKNIAKNFRIWVSSLISSNSKSLNWNDHNDSSTGFLLLHLSKLLWQCQIEGMVDLWQNDPNLYKRKNRIKERFLFLDSFLSHPTQDLLLEWHEKIIPEIKREIDEIAPAIQNFCFLAESFCISLKDVESPKYTETIGWLEEQSSDFITHLCYFFETSYLDDSLRPFFRKVDEKRVDLMRKEIENSETLYWKDKVLKIFRTYVPESHQDFAKLCMLVESMKSKISKVDDEIRYK
jgi:hypothetical protein